MNITYVQINFDSIDGISSRCDCPIVQTVLDAQDYKQLPDLWYQPDFQESEVGTIQIVCAIENPKNGVNILDSPFATEITKARAEQLQTEYFARKPAPLVHDLS